MAEQETPGAVTPDPQSASAPRRRAISKKVVPAVPDDRGQGDTIGGDKVAGDKIATQVNSSGAAVFLRAVEAQTLVGRDQITQNFNYGALPITWPKEDEERYRARLRQELTAMLGSRQVRPAGQGDWDSGFVQPLLSRRRLDAGPSGGGQSRNEETRRGTWGELVSTYPQVGALVGDGQSGRSLLMRWIVADLAGRPGKKDARILPIYLLVNRFPFGGAQGLLDAAAFACGQQPEAMSDLWRNSERSLLLAIDGADELPDDQRDAFVRALVDLDLVRRDRHSILVATRPGNDPASFQSTLTRAFATDRRWTQWIILPLDEGRVASLLDAYGAEPWLKTLIQGNEQLRWLVRHPGTLADLVRATRGLQLMAPPRNLAELYALFIDSYLFGSTPTEEGGVPRAKEKYHYGRVKRPLLGYLGFRMLASSRPSGLEIDDALCADLARQLGELAAAFARTRRYMPADWNVTDLLQELFASPVVDSEAAVADQIELLSPIYRNYYAAVHLHTIGEGWPEAADAIRASHLEDWTDALVLLSGLPPRSSTNALLNDVLSGRPGLAADLWLEKGAVGFTEVPRCVTDAFTARQIQLFDLPDDALNPAVTHLRRLVQSEHPAVALQSVNVLMQLGIEAVEPLLDAVAGSHPMVIASAIHALFHMGPFLALTGGDRQPCAAGAGRAPELSPLIVVEGKGFRFNNLGTCNATIGGLVLVSVPRTMQAEVAANLASVDFDLLSASCSFELWHKPLAWFAIDYFRQRGEVDWIGLAAACEAVVRCARLIVGKAMRPSDTTEPTAEERRERMKLVAEELSQCAITYDRLGRCIAADLAMSWPLVAVPTPPPSLIEAADQVYRELRLFFNRANRGSMLAGIGGPDGQGRGSGPEVRMQVDAIEKDRPVHGIEIDKVTGGAKDYVDLPDRYEAMLRQDIGKVGSGGELSGIRVGGLEPAPFLAAEVCSLCAELTVGSCEGGTIEGIRIDNLTAWNGLRAKLVLDVGSLSGARVTGIAADRIPLDPRD